MLDKIPQNERAKFLKEPTEEEARKLLLKRLSMKYMFMWIESTRGLEQITEIPKEGELPANISPFYLNLRYTRMNAHRKPIIRVFCSDTYDTIDKVHTIYDNNKQFLVDNSYEYNQ